ncbi:MAG: PHP domain-containing protein [Chloroflexi bacterium]|nr:PHP domain-containing protein [Chloroflexota bacterium]
MRGEIREYGKADIHLHTSMTDGSASVEQLLEYVEHESDLNVIAITDHDDMRAAYLARELAAKRNYRFDVIMGMEITTLNGHLLAIFLEKPVPSFRSIYKTIEAVHSQGGLCIAPHPMSWLTLSIGQSTLNRIVLGGDSSLYLDAIETANSTLAGKVSRKRVNLINKGVYHLPETGSSDAHFLSSVGRCYTLFPGESAQDLRRSLLEKTTAAGVTLNGPRRGVKPGEVLRHLTRALLMHPGRLAGIALARFLRFM